MSIVRSWRVVAATLVAAAAALPVPAALAAAGFSAPVTVLAAPAGACPRLSGGLIGWAQFTPTAHLSAEHLLDSAHVAALSAAGIAAETTIGPATGAADCPVLGAVGSGGVGLADVRTAAPITPLALPIGAPLWLSGPGESAHPTTDVAAQPTVALAPNGSGVVAWLHYVGLRPTGESAEQTGPAFTVQAARLAPDGQLGPAQQLAGPSAGDMYGDDLTGPLDLPGPVAFADADGTLVVAWAQLSVRDAGSTVQVSVAQPGQQFAAASTLRSPSAASSGEVVDQLALTGDGGGEHLLRWSLDNGEGIESAYQPSATAPFTGLARFPAGPVQRYQLKLAGVAGDEAGETTTLLASSDTNYAEPGLLALVRQAQPSSVPRLEYLVSPKDGENVGSPALAVSPDGAVAVVWVARGRGPDGGDVFRVMLATAPPAGPFAAPVALTDIATQAQAATVAYGPAGEVRVAWSTITTRTRALGARLFAVIAQSGAPDLLAAPGPRVTLSDAHRAARGEGLSVSVSVDRPCFVRLETVINGSAGSNGEGYAGVGRYFTAAGTARMSSTPARVGYVRGGHTRVTIVAYASAADGASTVAAIRVRGVNTLISAPLRVIHAR